MYWLQNTEEKPKLWPTEMYFKLKDPFTEEGSEKLANKTID